MSRQERLRMKHISLLRGTIVKEQMKLKQAVRRIEAAKEKLSKLEAN